MATSRSCCDLHFKCVDCPIITGPDCVCPNNLLPGQLWYNPCTCTFYFDNPNCPETGSECCEFEALNHKAGAGILYSGDCETGSYISVHIDRDAGFEFTEEGALTIDCERLIAHCELMHWNDPELCSRLIDHCSLWTRFNLTFNSQDFSLVCDPETNVCELQLNPETPFVRTRNAGELASAGVCIAVSSAGFNANGIAVLQMRDRTFIQGSGVLAGGAASYLQETVTNNWSTPALLEVQLIAQCNLQATAGVVAGFIHSITEQLNVTPPSFGAGNNPALPNWAYTVIVDNLPSFDPVPANPPFGVGAAYTPDTSSCFYSKVLQPGESVTLYYQWWAVFSSRYAGTPVYTLHGGMATATKLLRNVAPL